MRKTTPDDLEDCVDYYGEICDWVQSNKDAHPISLFTALAAGLWYISPSLEFNAAKTIENFALLVAKWEHRQWLREQKKKKEPNEDRT